MEQPDFERMVVRLEAKSRQAPLGYQINVALLAVLGFGILALIIGAAGVMGVALVALPFALWFAGFHSIGAFAALGKFLILLLVPLWVLVKSALSAVLTRLPRPQGVELTRALTPDLFSALDGMRTRMKGPRFHHVLVTQELNAAVVQRPLFGLFGPSRNYLILGLPLLDSLAPEEALAVVAHEYGHLAGSHSRFAAYIYRLRAGWATVQAVSQRWRGPVGGLLQSVVGWYGPYFNAYSFVLARANEYQADAASAELVGADVAVRALKRTDVNGEHYGRFVQQTFKSAADIPEPPADFTARWAALAREAEPEQAQRWLERALAAPGGVMNTHPPLSERVRALAGDAAAQDTRLPEPLPATTAADEWLGRQGAQVRDAVQRRWREAVNDHWQAQHEQSRKQRERLQALCALEVPTSDEHVERLQLRLACDATAEFSYDVASFIAAHPNNAVGPYLDGLHRLSQKDDTGLDSLERAMILDADATKAACERAFEYLKERGDPRAEQYKQRWHTRDEWERKVHPQMQQINHAHELRDPDLTAEQMAQIRVMVRANRQSVSRAYLARRVLPADPSVPTYVLGLELESPGTRVETPQRVVARVAGTSGWPVHVLVLALQDKNAPLLPKLRTLQHAEIGLSE